jgi:hypothetical protein
VLRSIAIGNANKQIADQLEITEESVKSRVKSILSKLGANDRTPAANDLHKKRNHRAVGFTTLPAGSEKYRTLKSEDPRSLWGIGSPSQHQNAVSVQKTHVAASIFHIRWRLAAKGLLLTRLVVGPGCVRT